MELEIRGPVTVPGKLLLSTAEPTVVDGNKLGQIDFQAPVDTAGTDAILVGASIYAEADATFSSSVNSTELVFATAASETAAEKMRITSDGKVGIGTSAPGAHLDVRGPAGSAAASAGILRLSTAETSVVDTDQFGRIEFIAPLEGSGTDAILVSASIWAQATDTFTTTANKSALVFATGTSETATEKMRITDTGNVGIGTTTPSSLLTLQDDDENGIEIKSAHSSDAAAPFVKLRRAEGTWASPNQIENGTILGQINFQGWNTAAANYKDGARIYCHSPAGWSSSSSGTDLKFQTVPAGSFTLADRMAIDSEGILHLGMGIIGAASIFMNSTNGLNHIYGQTNGTSDWRLRFGTSDMDIWDYSDGSFCAHITPGDNSWQAGSDERSKKDVVDIDSVLADINNLRPITYKRKYGKLGRTYSGLIAQEVVPLFPLVVSGSVDSFKELPAKEIGDLDDNGQILKEAESLRCEGGLTVGYAEFVPYLIKAVQELSAKVTALENA
jgi:hypothetical protein